MIEEEKFENLDFSTEKLKHTKFELCVFSNCNFANVHLTEKVFTECTFDNCDFSNATLGNTGFREIKFQNCKMLGLSFEHCNPFLLSFGFEDCTLDFSSFFQMKIQGTVFKNCSLKEVDFTETDLQNAVFDSCNLENAIFENTLLQKSDFRTALNFSIDPSNNFISKAQFSKNNLHGLLTKFNIQID